jgi:hypothetical protein
MNKRHICLLCIAILAILILAYLFINPILFFKLGRVLPPRRLANLESARNYYSILSSFAGFGLGIMGLLVGYLYYAHKQASEQKASERERKRKRLDDLISELRDFDNLIDDLIYFRFQNHEELEILRHNIERVFDAIRLKLNASQRLFGLGKDDIAPITRIWAFVEKNEDLMLKGYGEIDQVKFREYRDEYHTLVEQALSKCFEKVA